MAESAHWNERRGGGEKEQSGPSGVYCVKERDAHSVV